MGVVFSCVRILRLCYVSLFSAIVYEQQRIKILCNIFQSDGQGAYIRVVAYQCITKCMHASWTLNELH